MKAIFMHLGGVLFCFIMIRMQKYYHEQQYIKLSVRKALQKIKGKKVQNIFWDKRIEKISKFKFINACLLIYSNILLLIMLLIVFIGILLSVGIFNTSVLDFSLMLGRIAFWSFAIIFSINISVYTYDDRPRKSNSMYK